MIAEKYKDYMYHFIDDVLKKIGPRESCSEAEKALGRYFADEVSPDCDEVRTEKFMCSPTAFLGFLPFAVMFYIGSLALYWVFPPLSFVLAAVGFSMLLFEFVRYREFVDFLFPKREGENVLGIIKPRGAVKQRVVVSAHLDSAYEFNLWLLLKNLAIPVMVVAVLGVALMFGVSLAKAIMFFTGGADAPIFNILGIACIALYPLVGLFMLFHSYVPVLGAMDDLAGVAIVAGLGKYLSDAKKSGGFFPENTEVVLFGCAAEEAGLRGAKRYVEKHRGEHSLTPTYGIFLDGIYDEKFLTVVNREICTGAKHDPYLIKLAESCAGDRGWPIMRKPIPLGGSDAAAFSREGRVPSTCLLCQDTSKLVPNYHTRFDTIDKIRPESLTVSLQLVIDMLQKIDEKAAAR